MLIVFLYYVILGVITLAAFSINANVHYVYTQKLQIYFACESTTPGSCENSKTDVMRYFYPEITDTAYIVLALFPLVNMVYAFSFDELKEICCKRFCVKKITLPSASSMKTLVDD